jgi:hypothetical protein
MFVHGNATRRVCSIMQKLPDSTIRHPTFTRAVLLVDNLSAMIRGNIRASSYLT